MEPRQSIREGRSMRVMAARIAVVQFPGTNCERETARSLRAWRGNGLTWLTRACW